MDPLKPGGDIEITGEYMSEDFTKVEVNDNYMDLPENAPGVYKTLDVDCKTKICFQIFRLEYSFG